MSSKAERLLVVESDDALREQIVAVLRDAGYEVSTDYQQGMKAVLFSEIKESEHTQNIRVLMLSPGGSAERTRGWWQNDDLKEMLDQGLEPVVAEMTAYFPGVPHGIAISSAADVAIVKANVSQLGIKQIVLADGRRSAVSGAPSCSWDILPLWMQFWPGRAQRRSSSSLLQLKASRSR